MTTYSFLCQETNKILGIAPDIVYSLKETGNTLSYYLEDNNLIVEEYENYEDERCVATKSFTLKKGDHIILPDGRVFCIPFTSTTARIYNPIIDVVTTPSGAYPGSSAFVGGVLLPDGRVFWVPRDSTTARIATGISDLTLIYLSRLGVKVSLLDSKLEMLPPEKQTEDVKAEVLYFLVSLG